MTRLLRAELRRVAARRLVRMTVLLGMVLIAGGGILAFATSSSLSESAYRERVREATAERNAEETKIATCLRAHGIEPRKGPVPDDVARQCFPNRNIQAHDPRFHHTRLKGILQGVSGVLAIVGWVLGASLVGAEFASRGMTTQLTWETRRTRVLVAKVAVVFAATAALAAGVLVLTTAAMLPSLAAHGAPLAREPGWATLAGVVARGVVLATLAAGMGFAIATIGRNTAAALGAGFTYIIVIENILGSSIAGWRRWLLLGNVIVFVSGQNGGADVPGRSVVGAGLFLLAIAVTLVAAAGIAFRTRDIA